LSRVDPAVTHNVPIARAVCRRRPNIGVAPAPFS